VNVIASKICSKCGKKLPVTTEFFYKNKGGKYGFRSECKKCLNKQHKKYRQQNQEKEIFRHKKYYNTLIGYLQYCFAAINQRCNNSNNRNYKHYGGRGIKCLFKSSNEFIDYIINILKIDPRGLQIDRINNDGNYEPGNIRFVTHRENQQNKRNRK